MIIQSLDISVQKKLLRHESVLLMFENFFFMNILEVAENCSGKEQNN